MPRKSTKSEAVQAETVAETNREAVLACLACRWARRDAVGEEKFALAGEISQCRKLSKSAVHGILNNLVGLGLVEKNRMGLQVGELTGYQPATSSLGEAFEQSLEVPETCLLHDEEPGSPTEEFMLWLLAEAKEPEETMRRLIYVSEDRWARLEELAKGASASLGINVTRTKVVDFLISRGLRRFDEGDKSKD